MSKELINFKSLLDDYGKELVAFEIFSQETAHGKKCWSELNTRVVEHVNPILSVNLLNYSSFTFYLFQNIRIISNYYTRINIKRMSELLSLPDGETEEYLSKLVNNSTITVKIDRPAGVIHFESKKAPSDVLNDWAQGINELMSLVNKTCHLINKEECINSVQLAA